MPEDRFLILRLGSLGDIVHTLPAVSALRSSFPRARIHWVVEQQWCALLEGNPDLNGVIALERRSWRSIRSCVKFIRAARYSCALDFQGLYKSALLVYFSGAPRCIGWDARSAREPGAAWLYTESVVPSGTHVIDQNLSLAARAGATPGTPRFPLQISRDAEEYVQYELTARGISDFYVLNPGGGWRGKCWPAEWYGHLHRRLAEKHGWRGVVSYGPEERALAEAVRLVAGEPEPYIFPLDLAQLMAAVARAKFFLGGDTGPLHLAVALGTPVVGLYGPTDPARNGPYNPADIVVRNAGPADTTYKRGGDYHPTMRSITVEQVMDAIERSEERRVRKECRL